VMRKIAASSTTLAAPLCVVEMRRGL